MVVCVLCARAYESLCWERSDSICQIEKREERKVCKREKEPSHL